MKKKVVVIGAGLGGSLLCNELAGDCDVILLEKGSKSAIGFPQLHFISKILARVPTFCFGGGGTTNLWHNGLIPINPEDVTLKDFRDVLVEARFYTDEAASRLFFRDMSFMAEYDRLKAEINNLSERFSCFPHGIDCLIYPKKYRSLTLDTRVRAVYDVTDIQFFSAGNKIIRIDYTTGQQKSSIDIELVVVSAGAMGTPGILKKIIEATGKQSNHVGRGFMDHPMGFVGKVRFSKDISGAAQRLSLLDRKAYISRNAVRLKSPCGRYSACAFFRPAISMVNDLGIYKYKSSLGANTGLNRLKNLFSLKLFHPDILVEIAARFAGGRFPGRTYNILFIAEQKRGDNRVYHEGERIAIDWKISDEEILIYREMLKRLQGMLSDVAEKVNIETNISEDWLWSAAHHSGTTPMGENESDLIDGNLKLRLCQNVFVCDGSVIQEHSYANTGLSIGQFAVRLARKIQENVKG